jgi:ABC-type phosphate transport system substrate-binding protein
VIKSALIPLLIFFSLLVHAVDQPQPPLVVAHSAVTVQSLSKSQLRSIYLKRQVIWPNGDKIKVYMLPAKSVTHQQFSQSNLQMFPYQLDQTWQKLTFSGIGTPPVEIATEAQMLQLIQTTPGAIGYLPYGNEINDAKVIEIQP